MKAPRLLVLSKLMVVGDRQPLTHTPAEVGLDYQDVSFKSTDDIDIEGWFVPAATSGPAPTVVWVHGWLWNRVGNVAGRVPFTDRDVDFLPPTRALHDAGFNVLLFDLSNHGRSGRRLPLTFGPFEARDFVGAVRYVRSRADVDGERIGVIGTSMGGNIALIGAGECLPIKAMLFVQPTKPYAFTTAFAADVLGRIGSASVPLLNMSYVAARAPRPSTIDPGEYAARLTDTQQKYVQGTGDPWGSMDIVQSFVDRSPRVLPLVKYPSAGRYEGYRYVTEQAADVAAYFTEYL